ncbi:MAG TPA: hypothetical protein VGB42_06220 [Candidatus Thermoplasmatota archaeon]
MGRRVEEDSGVDTRRLATLARGLARQPVGRRWWPYRDPFALALSAVLTQQTRWEAAAAGVERLRERGLLDPRALALAPPGRVEDAVRPTGFFRRKAGAIQGIARRVEEAHGGDIRRALRGPIAAARAELLGWPGVGPETADAILLFAGRRPAFVVDAYTRRLMTRYGALAHGGAGAPYGRLQAAWAAAVEPRAARYAHLHAAIVELCKSHCRRIPRCGTCPLRGGCERVGAALAADGSAPLGGVGVERAAPPRRLGPRARRKRARTPPRGTQVSGHP